MNKIKRKKINKYVLYFFASVVIFIAIFMIAKGKYKLGSNTLHAQNSEAFYFESNLLSDQEQTYTYSNWDGQSEYILDFDVANFTDSLRINTLQTEYEVLIPTITGLEIQSYINGTQATNGQMLPNTSIKDNIQLKINSQDSNPISFQIQVKSSKPYEKVLLANIIINPNAQDEQYKVNLENDLDKDYAKLDIKTNKFSGNLKIAYDSTKIIPDLSSTYLQGVSATQILDSDNYYIEINLAQNTNYEIYFIKNVANSNITLGDDISICDIVVGY